MSYAINYGIQPQEHMYHQKKSRFSILCISFFLLFLIIIHLFRPDMVQTMQNLLLPESGQTAEHIQTMVNQVVEGVPITDAIAAFCQKIIHNATLS
jgi:hypothetical protein